MIKLIASDLDGTLLQNGAQELNPEIYDLILALKERGIHFAAASGRQYASERNLFKPIADEISYIAENGAVCIHNNQIISITEIDRDLAFRIIDAIKQCPNCKPLVSCLNCCYIESGDDEYLYHIRHVVHNNVDTVDDFASIQEPILKIALLDIVTPQQSATYLRELFKNEIKVVTSGMDWIDFVPLHSNKGTALKTLLETLHLSPEEAVSFGDQQNDIEMLTLAQKSYAMATAPDDVKNCAYAVTDSVEKILKQIIKETPKA